MFPEFFLDYPTSFAIIARQATALGRWFSARAFGRIRMFDLPVSFGRKPESYSVSSQAHIAVKKAENQGVTLPRLLRFARHAGLACAGWLAAISVAAQSTTGLDGGRPAATVVGDTGAPYENLFRPASIGGSAWTPKIGSGHLNVPIPSIGAPTYSLPLINRGFRPEEAEIKIGGLYIDFRDASASLLASDNINASHTARKSGAISVVRLGVGVLFQLNEGLRLATYGSFIWLPFRNKAGVNGFGITDPLDANFNFSPIARMQLVYDGTLGSWDFRLIDEFDVTTPTYSSGLQVDQQFEGTSFDEADRSGRYEYRAGGITGTRGATSSRSQGFENFDVIYHNMAGAQIHRLLPIDVAANLAYFHHNYWYSNGRIGGVSELDEVRSSLISQHENMRFKPYFRQNSSTDDTRSGWDHQASVGFVGPASDYIDILAEYGRFWQDNSSQSSAIWRARIDHNLGPLTTHSLEYRRTVTRPERTLQQALTYRLYQVLGPYMDAEFFAERQRVKTLTVALSGYTLDQLGLRMHYNLGVRTDLRATMLYQTINIDNPASEEVDNYVARLEFIRAHTETMSSTILYEFTRRDSTVTANSYYENLILYTLRKSF